MALINLPMAERLAVWKTLGKYRNERLKLNWGFFRPSVKVEAILIALIGPEPVV